VGSLRRFANRYQKTKNPRGRRAAVKTNGFSSKLENKVHEMLLERVASGELSDLRCQHRVDLIYGETHKNRMEWKIDFSAIDNATGNRKFFEAKGFSEDIYKIKLKLFRVIGEGVLEIWKYAKGGSIYLSETVVPSILNASPEEQNAIKNQFGTSGQWEDRRLRLLDERKAKRKLLAKQSREIKKAKSTER